MPKLFDKKREPNAKELQKFYDILTAEERVQLAEEAHKVILPPVAVLNSTCQILCEYIGCESSNFSVITGGDAVLKAGYNLPKNYPLNVRHPLSSSICTFVVAQGQPLMLPDTSKHDFLQNCTALPDVKSYLGVPVRWRGVIIGALAVFDSKLFNFKESHIDLVSSHAIDIEKNIKPRD